MTNQELQEQAEKMYPINCQDKGNCVHEWCAIKLAEQNAWTAGAKWMQERDKWIEIKSKADLPKIRCSCWFWDKPTNKPILGEFLNNGKDEVNYILTNASHYLIVDLPSPPKTK